MYDVIIFIGVFFISVLFINFLTTDNWAKKAVRRRSTGTGRMSHILDVQRRWKNHFREGIIIFFM